MAAYNKFNLGVQDLCRGILDFQSGAATFKVMLTNTAPVATNHVYSDISANEVASGGGYTTGGITCAMSDSGAGGTEKVLATNVTWTGSGAGFGPLRYAVVYLSSGTTNTLWCWFDYGSNVSVAAGATFAVNFDAANGLFQVT